MRALMEFINDMGRFEESHGDLRPKENIDEEGQQ